MAEYIITDKLNVFDQLAVARKISPALPIVDGLIRKDNEGKDKTLLVVLLLGQLSDNDSDFVIRRCLSVVSRVQENAQAAKVLAKDGSLMFDDLDMGTITSLVSQVLEVNLGDFLRTALSGLKEDREEAG
jgi:hypothetical protein